MSWRSATSWRSKVSGRETDRTTPRVVAWRFQTAAVSLPHQLKTLGPT